MLWCGPILRPGWGLSGPLVLSLSLLVCLLLNRFSQIKRNYINSKNKGFDN